MKVVFDTDSVQHYTFAHGKAPRGIGLWRFFLERDRAFTSFEHNGSYTDAKKAAMAEARRLGCETVGVES